MSKDDGAIGDSDIEDLQFKQNKSTVSFQKTLEEFVNSKQTSITMDALNLIFTSTNSCIYVYRTYNMCYFDKNPIWVVSTEESPVEMDECSGTGHLWYYSVLITSHVYFLLEFILRASVQKQQFKFLLSVDSFIELMTTVPFLITLSFGMESYYF